MTDENTELQEDDLEIENAKKDSEDENEAVVEYDIASYPSDFNLDNLYSQWKKDSFVIPDFQREFVWGQKRASLLIDSFMMGLPVPPVFLYLDEDNRYLVIDGQQRLRSIFYFYEGFFGEEKLGKRKVFKLTGLDDSVRYSGKTYKELSADDRRKLDGSILRAINIRQISPSKKNTSAYHIFERLNTGGTPLKPQEIRNCVFAGGLVPILRKLNDNEHWRKIMGTPSLDKYQKDIELILRLFALIENGVHAYQKPMKEFLNLAMKRHKKGDSDFAGKFEEKFVGVCKYIVDSLGNKPFHIRGPLNAAYLDSVFCVIYKHFESLPDKLANNYDLLKNDSGFNEKYTRLGTQDTATLKARYEQVEQILIGTTGR